MARIYNNREIEKIGESGKILRGILESLNGRVKEGISTLELDDFVYKKIKKSNSLPTFLGYQGIPDKNRILKKGDIVSIDIGVTHKGYIADSAMTYSVGDVSPDAKKLMEVTYNSLLKAIQQAVPDNRIGDIGYAVESYVTGFNYKVIRDFVGHGVGCELHEEPQVPNYGKKGTGARLKSGMILAIEPMVSIGTDEILIKDNDWTAVTADKTLSAHYEHTLAITDDGPRILSI